MRAREPTLRIVCPHCHEAADFGVAKLIASKGRMHLPEVH
jgi:hypothetical protein